MKKKINYKVLFNFIQIKDFKIFYSKKSLTFNKKLYQNRNKNSKFIFNYNFKMHKFII